MKRLVYLPLLLILLVSWISGVLPWGQPTRVYAQSTVTLYPSTVATTIDDIYDDVDWATPGNVGADDSLYAEYVGNDLDTGFNMYVLKATNFGFIIPTGSTINGIKLEFERADASDDAGDALVQLVKGGTRLGENKSAGAAYPATEAITVFGSETDLWTLSWSDTDINALDFGVAVSATCVGVKNARPQIDFLRITVYYTPPPADISNTPSTWEFGAVDPSMEYTTDIPYVLNETGFQITNNSGYAVNITISATNMGTGWLLADDGIPLATYYALWAGTEDTGGAYSIMVTSTGELLTTVAASVGSTKDWGLKLMTPTPLSFGDGGLKSGTVTLTATAA